MSIPDDTRHPDHPNQKIYHLSWTDTGAPYVHPTTHKVDFHLDEALRHAQFENVTVTDPETGNVLWVGSRAMRAGALRAGPIDLDGDPFSLA